MSVCSSMAETNRFMASAHSSSGMTGISVMGKRVGSPSKYVPHDRTETSCGIDMPASCNAISTWLRTLAFAWLMMADRAIEVLPFCRSPIISSR